MDPLSDPADAMLERELTLLLLPFEFRGGSSTVGWICTSDNRTVTMESVGRGKFSLLVSTVGVIDSIAEASMLKCRDRYDGWSRTDSRKVAVLKAGNERRSSY